MAFFQIVIEDEIMGMITPPNKFRKLINRFKKWLCCKVCGCNKENQENNG